MSCNEVSDIGQHLFVNHYREDIMNLDIKTNPFYKFLCYFHLHLSFGTNYRSIYYTLFPMATDACDKNLALIHKYLVQPTALSLLVTLFSVSL
ncbi:hypothetical protein HMSSN139_07980 [Paenibacillus sp. HMSSN-139]|nr:hypothetical protein HMSSN139_07980 [Paenibacillus sp. HMSSN-139]